MHEQVPNVHTEVTSTQSSRRKRIKDGAMYAGTVVALEAAAVAIRPLRDDIEYVRNYANDNLIAMINYFVYRSITKFLNLDFKGARELTALSSFAIPSYYEFEQRHGSGTYDPKDFLAIAAGAGIAYGVDKLATRRERKEETIVFESK